MNKSRIGKTKQHQLIKHFLDRISARKAAILTDLNRNSVNFYYQRLREVIAEYADTEAYGDINKLLKKDVEVEDSFYGIADIKDSDIPLVGLKVQRGFILVKEITKSSTSPPPSFIPDSIIYRNEDRQLIEYNVSLAKRHNRVVKNSRVVRTPLSSQIGEFWRWSVHSGKTSGSLKQESIILRIKVEAWIFNESTDMNIEEIAAWVKDLIVGRLV